MALVQWCCCFAFFYEEVREDNQWDVAEGHCFKLGEWKSMGTSHYALRHEPGHLAERQQLRGIVCNTLVTYVLLR